MFIMYKEVGIVCTKVHSPFLLKTMFEFYVISHEKTPQCSQKKLPSKLKSTDF